MTPLKLDQFEGIYPRVSPSLLADRAAVAAEWCDFGYGELRSMKDGFLLRTLAAAATSLFSEDGVQFYAWPQDVNTAISPLLSGASADRLYYTDGSDFRHAARSGATTNPTTPGTSYRVGVPRPSVAPTIGLSSAPPAGSADLESRAYLYTYVNIFGEEGPPSPAVGVDVLTTTGVTVYFTIDSFASYAPIKEVRIYRTQSGGTTATFYYATTFGAIGATGAQAVGDGVSAALLNEPLASTNYYAPAPNLQGLMALGNGILAAWTGNTMFFCEPYKPWAWPPQNVVTFNFPIVGAMPHGTGALVTTRGAPALVSGVSSDAMTQTPLDVPHAGVSKWALVDLAGVAAYATNDGIVLVSGTSASITLSERYFTREVWRTRYAAGLSSMQFAFYDGKLLVFSRAGLFTPFMLKLDEAQGSMSDLPGFVAATSLVLVTSDGLYYLVGANLYQFGGGAAHALYWKSRELVLATPGNFGIARALCIGTFTIRFYADGVLRHTQVVTSADLTFRLPSGFTALRWQIDIAGTGTFRELRIADTGRALALI